MNENLPVVDVAKIRMAINAEVPLTITTYTLPHRMELYMNAVLTTFFKELHQEHMIQYLIYCQNELVTNAKKANTKRIYFKEKNLDITEQSDYEKGMKTFKSDTLENISFYLAKQKEAGLYVKLVLQVKNGMILMEVDNNSELTYFEFKRIHDKLCRAQQYTSVEDTINQVLDDSEGAGLGLVIMILMLRKLGMSEDNFNTFCENGVTKTQILLPMNKEFANEVSVISEELQKTINDLPQFPRNITKLSGMLDNPDSNISDIAMLISQDVSITGEILKLANSSALGLTSKCGNVTDAVKMIGFDGIKKLLVYLGSAQVFSKLPGNAELLWLHAYRVAFISYNIAKNYFPSNRPLVEDSYVCGLTHDMGQILFEGIHPSYIEKVKEICGKKGIDINFFEKLLSGVNHAELGARIAEKWNFPQEIVDVVRYHHTPSAAPEASAVLVKIIFLADIMVHYISQEIDYYQIDKDILAYFKFSSQKQFDEVIEKLKSGYDSITF